MSQNNGLFLALVTPVEIG